MIWRIAFRNLTQHKTKTLIIGLLIALALMLTVAGNAVISTMGESIKNSFRNNYTGDILITSDEAMAGIFGAQSNDSYGPPVIPVLKDYDAALAELKAVPGLDSFTNQMSAYVIYNFEEKGYTFSLNFGIDPDDYWKTMDNIKLLEGRMLKAGEQGLMINSTFVKKAKEENNVSLAVGQEIQINSFGEAGLHIVTLPIIAIFEFKSANQRLIAPTNICDIQTMRYLGGKKVGPSEIVQVDSQATALIDNSLDDLFGDAADNSTTVTVTKTAKTDEATLNNLLGEKKAAPAAPVKDGSWHFILAKLQPGTDVEKTVEALNAAFEAKEIGARAQDWQPSGAPESYLFWFLGLIFNFLMILLAFVSVIIITNTLVISVMERTSEIGTMRALGAQKGTVRKLFIAETFTISAVAGVAGIVLGALVTWLISAIGIPADNDFMAVVYGGATLRPVMGLASLIWGLVLILLIGLTAWIYPVSLALKVSPLKAISTE